MLKQRTAREYGADASAEHLCDCPPCVEDWPCRECQQRPESPLPRNQPRTGHNRGGKMRDQHDRVSAAHPRQRRIMRCGVAVVHHHVRAGRRGHSRHTASRATHGCWGRDGCPAEQLQRRVQQPRPPASNATARTGLVASANGATMTTVRTNKEMSTEVPGVTPSAATWPASPLANSTDASVSTRTWRGTASLVMSPSTPECPPIYRPRGRPMLFLVRPSRPHAAAFSERRCPGLGRSEGQIVKAWLCRCLRSPGAASRSDSARPPSRSHHAGGRPPRSP